MKLTKLASLFFLIMLSFACRKEGCTDVTAANYNPEAKKDDGTCVMPENVTPLIMQNNLIGSWTGNGTADFSGGIQWKARFTIESNGHYTGQVTSVQYGTITSVFNNGDDSLDHPEKKFTMQTIDAFGKANGKVTFVHSGDDLIEYQIKDLVFSNTNEKLDFVVAWGAEMEYSLTRD